MSDNYQKGMRGFGDQPGKRNDRWDRNLEKLEQPQLNKPQLIRPVSGLVTVAVHYLKFPPKPGKKGGGFFTLCPNWDLVEGDIDGNCPVCANFHRYLEVSKTDEYLQMPQKLRYLFHAFHVDNIRSGAKDRPLFGLVETHVMGMEEIEKAMLIKKGVKPDDSKNGYCLVWLLSPSAKGTNYGPDVSFTGDEKMPVRKHAEKKGVWQIKLDGEIYEGAEQQLFEAIPAPPTAAQLDKKLASMGLYDALDKALGTGSRRAAATSVTDDLDDADDGFGDSGSGTVDTEEPDDPTWDPDADDSGGDSVEGESDSFDDADADDSGDFDDDVTEGSTEDDGFAEVEEEEEPPKKPAKKKATGKKKKQTKKPKEEPAADDGDGDNWDDF